MTKLAALPLQRLEPILDVGWAAGSPAAVDLRLLYPLMQCLRGTAIFAEIERTAAQREACSPSCFRTVPTARVLHFG